jgi:cell division protein FtsB
MTKFLSLITIVALGVITFLAIHVQEAKVDNDALRADVTQLQTEMDAKLKSISSAVDTLNTKVSLLEQGHVAVTPDETPKAAAAAPIAPTEGASVPSAPASAPAAPAAPPAAAPAAR